MRATKIEKVQPFIAITGKKMRQFLVVVACAISCLIAQQADAAIKFKRFPHCPAGLVTKKTCECHAGESGRYHFCHTGYQCDTVTGKCSK
jgi:hypothetical protein